MFLRNVFWGLVALLLAISSGFSLAVAENQEPKFINLAVIADLSGPYAPMVKMKDFAPLGGLTYYSFSEKRRSSSKTLITQVKSGRLVPIGDWRVAPDLRPAKYK